MADYAEDQTKVIPPLLEVGFACEHYRSLPLSGGIYDQPAGLMRKITQVMNVFNAYKLYDRDGKEAGGMAKWRNEHEDLWDIVSDVEKLRENYG